ncbi:MAG TPA: class I adenylate-forming enzyme family protein [Acidimicrobiales bacterium]|nr:class I adenylate-forming enzyme family protein [Acidimicrobiales bacterium]
MSSDPVRHFLDAWEQMTAPGGPFAMNEIEIRGQTNRVFATAPATMREVWDLSALQGDRPYLIFEDEHLSYAETHRLVRALAHRLRDDYGVGSGDRVAVSMRNYPEWVIAYWATVSIGAALVGMNAWWTTAEMDFALRDAQPEVVIVDSERLERLVPIFDDLRRDQSLQVIATRVDRELPAGVDRWDDVIAGAVPDTLPAVQIDPDDDATIFYTSGTTGKPKGAQITHRGSVHNVLHLVFWTLVTVTAQGAAAAEDATNGAADGDKDVGDEPASKPLVYLATTPLFHVTACNCVLHPVTLAGGTLVLMHKWDAGRALELIEREGVTNLAGVPTMSRELLMHPDYATRDTSTLASLSGGGAPVPPDLVEKIGDALGEGSASTGYGLTETSGIVTANIAATYETKPSSCGPIVPTLDAKLCDPTGAELPRDPDTVGQLWVKGPVVIKGYLNRPEATAEAIVDGWFDTGDIGRIDSDGFLFLVDRAKDMVLRGGEIVYCAEVEAAIYEHPDVAEAAVFGVPDERLGEAVAAAIVVRDGSTLDEAGLRTFLDGRIAAHKIPTTTWFRTESLPRNATGKFLKRALRDELLGA